MEFTGHTPPIGAKVCKVTGPLTYKDVYTIVENDEYMMAELLVIENYKGKRSNCFGSEVAYVTEDDVISPPDESYNLIQLGVIIDSIVDSSETPADGEAWAYQDGWNEALAKLKVVLSIVPPNKGVIVDEAWKILAAKENNE